MTRRPEQFGSWVHRHLNHRSSVGMLANWLLDHGIAPGPDRQTPGQHRELAKRLGWTNDEMFELVVRQYEHENTVGSRVYFIQSGDGGPIKIGITDDVPTRLAQLQTSNPFKLRVLGSFVGSAYDERRLHEQFQRWRLEGEWFVPTPELLDTIVALTVPR